MLILSAGNEKTLLTDFRKTLK